jgi:UDP-2-acetamido-2-deoxy-ribo-hexuluronate aminotransferase
VAHARHKFVLMTDRRAELQRHLYERGVPTKRHYEKALPEEPLFGVADAWARFPVACQAADEAVSLPIHPFLSDKDVDYVVGAIREFFA